MQPLRFATPAGVELDETSARRLLEALANLETIAADIASVKIQTATKLHHTQPPLQLLPKELDAVRGALLRLNPHERTSQLLDLQIAIEELLD